MIGTKVSHYKILEKIGEGGMGEIFLAEDTKLQRRVALKFLPADLTKDKSRKQRFIQEARAAASMEHPNIAAIYDIDEVDGRTFIAMEFVRGESLREAIRKGRLGVRRTLELGSQMADGLAKAHERGVIHRDLKPDNVLLSEDGFAKIIDFGLAKLGEPFSRSDGDAGTATAEHEAETLVKTQEGLVLGTIAYMSPEQARANPVDARTDIFSLGVVIQEMLTGQAPFNRGNVAETLSAILKESPPALPAEVTGTAPELQPVLRKALAKDPDSRYAEMKDLAGDLKDMREELGSGVHPALSRLRVAKWLRVAAALAIVALGLAAAAWFLARPGDELRRGIGAAGRPAIAVMYFEDNTGSEEVRWLSKGLPNMLLTDLAQTPGLDVVSRQRILEILKQVGEDDLEAIDASLIPEVARQAGAGAVVGGSIYKVGDDIRIDVQVEDVASGRILSAHSVRGNDVFPLVDELSGQIRDSLDMTDAPDARDIAEVTTGSLEAYRLYSEGVEARRNLRRMDARGLLERAIEIDPTFAMAYYELAKTPERVGEAGSNNEYVRKVLQYMYRLPERQRLLVEAAQAIEEDKDPEKAEELLETLLSRYPDEEEAYFLLASVHGERNQSERYGATLERGVAAVPNSGLLRNQYGYHLLGKGRYEEAIHQFETYARMKPSEPNPHDSLAEAYLISGQPEKAAEEYARALEADPTFFASHGGRAWAFAILGQYDDVLEELEENETVLAELDLPTAGNQFGWAFVLSRLGRYAESKERLLQGIEGAREAEQGYVRAHLLFLAAQVAIERGKYEAALVSLGQSKEGVRQEHLKGRGAVVAHLLAGVAEARLGNLDAARTHLETQKAIHETNDALGDFWLHSLEAEIALAAGDLEAAETAFLAGLPTHKAWFSNSQGSWSTFTNNLPFRDGQARIQEARGDLTGAIEIYRGLLAPGVDSKWTAALEPRYVLQLARLLEKSGDTQAARREYKRFLDLWKDADPHLPELKEAQSYLAS